MTRWLLALGIAALVIAAGWIVFLNPAPVVLHVSPGRTVAAPLAVLVLSAFAGGAALVMLVTSARASARGWRRWRAERRAARDARRAASLLRARELAWAGDYPQARAELARGDVAEPDAERVVLLAETHIEEGDLPAARAVLDTAIARLGHDPHLLDLLADVAGRAGDSRAAVDALERAHSRHPDSPRLARRLRDAYAAAGRWADALALQSNLMLRVHEPAVLTREKAIERGLRYELAVAESDARRAPQLLRVLAREDPSFVPAWVSAGDRLLAAGRRLAARRTWERGARQQPAAILLDRIAQLHPDRPERVTRIFHRLQRRHPASVAVPFALVRHLLAHGQLDAAAAELEKLPVAATTHPLAHALWGDLHRRRGNHTLAAESLARALDTTGNTFRCTACGAPNATWQASCPTCHRWNTLAATTDTTSGTVVAGQ